MMTFDQEEVDTGARRDETQRRVLGFSVLQCAFIALWLIYLVIAMVKASGIEESSVVTLSLITFFCLGVHLAVETGAYTKIMAALPPMPANLHELVLGSLAALAGVVIFIQLIEAEHRGLRLQGLLGTVTLTLLCILISWKPRNIPWKVVASGCLVQFFLGWFVLNSETGVNFFDSLGSGVNSFLNFADVGASFVFGEDFKDSFFAFKVLPTIVFFSAFVSAMYFLGVMQVVVRVIALFLKKTIGTSLVQSVNAAGNMFLGQTEAPLLVRQFLPRASPCDLHCVMTGGFASIAGGVLVAFIEMKVSAAQLIGASLLSVPGTLFVSNMVCPPGSLEEDTAESETGGAKDDADDNHFEFEPVTDNNIIEAAGSGAALAISLVANIAAMLIAFLSLVSLLDSVLGHLGTNVGVPNLSFGMICGYFFFPLAWLIGCPYEDCFPVAKLIGTKVFVNEFAAYLDMVKVRDSLTDRGELVATYALCGFSNFASIGIQLGALSALAESRKGELAKLVLSAMISGNIVCFMTASYASILS